MTEHSTGPNPPRQTRVAPRDTPLTRRALITGAVPVTAAAIGAVAAMATQLSPVVEAPGTVAPAAPATPTPRLASPPATPFAAPAEPGTPATGAAARTLTTVGLPEGMALVASPRLPLNGVGPEDPWRLLNGRVMSWAEVGAALPWPVRPVALRDETAGVVAEQIFADYDELATDLATDVGAVALVPLDAVDFRVKTLLVGEDDPLISGVASGAAVCIGVVGDITPGRNVHLHMEQYGDFTRPFHRIAPLLRSFDVMVANLEGNLSATLPQPADPHSVSFVSNPAMLEGFAQAGIDAVTLANNHTVWNSENWGLQGLLDTMGALDDFGLPYFGAGLDIEAARAPWLVEANGIRIAFLGIDAVTANYEVEPGVATGVLDFDAGAGADYAGTNPYLAAQISADVTAATAVADVVIPYFHLGAEYVAVPPPWAVEATHLAIDAGAAMVVTNHPHLIQGMEIYAGKPIVYSPGNFILDQMWAVEVRSGYALEIALHGTKIAGLRFHGVEIEDFHQPRLMTAGEQAALMDRFWAATDRLAERSGVPS